MAGHRNGSKQAVTVDPAAVERELRAKVDELERQVNRLSPKAGERGQVRSAFTAYLETFGIPNPDTLQLEDYQKMLNDPQVRAGSRIRKYAILAKDGDFHYAPKDPTDEEEKAHGKMMVEFLRFVKSTVRPNWNQILYRILSARDYGFSVSEKVWRSTYGEDGKPILWPIQGGAWDGFLTLDRIKLLPPEGFADSGFYVDPFGRLRAAYQQFLKGKINLKDYPDLVIDPSKDDAYHRVAFRGPDVDRLIVYTANEDETPGSLYGRSDLRAMYNHWFSKQALLSFADVFLERTAGTVIAELEDMKQASASITALENAGAGSVVVMPKDSKTRVMEGGDQVVQQILRLVEYHDLMILRAALVPNETVGGSTTPGGSYARASSHFDSFVMACGQIAVELEELVEERIIKPLIDANFGPQEVYPSFDFPSLREKDRAAIMEMWSKAIATGVVDPAIDAMWLREELGVPEEAQVPDGYQFSRPATAPPAGEPFSDGVRAAIGAAARAPAPDAPPVRFEHVDAPADVEATVEHFENLLRSLLGEALHPVHASLLEAVPTDASETQLARITIDPAAIRDVFTSVASRVLERVQADVARKLGTLRKTPAATPPPTTVAGRAWRRVRGLLRAADEDPLPLDSYHAYAENLARVEADRIAAELAQRLRRRVLKGHGLGLTVPEIGRGLSEEFSTYTQAQLDTVARTTVMDYYNTARNATFDAAGDYVLGVKIVALLDNHNTPFCRSIHGRSIAKTDPLYDRIRKAPYWYGCRTITVPVLSDEPGHVFDTDWAAWFEQHRGVEGGGFLYGDA